MLVANIDSVWIETGRPAVADLRARFDPDRMDALLLLTPTKEAMGFDGPGDFHMDAQGRLTPRRVAGTATAPFAYIGVHATRTEAIFAHPPGKFSLMPEIWGAMAAAGRLHGLVLQGQWMHVGDPAARDAAEARLRS